MTFFLIIPIGLIFALIAGFAGFIGTLLLLLGGAFVFLTVAHVVHPLAAVALLLAVLIGGPAWYKWRHTPAGQRYWPALRGIAIVAALIGLALAMEQPGPAQSLKHIDGGKSAVRLYEG